MRLVECTLVAVMVLALPQPQPARAAWIVLQGGEVLQTQGAWKVEGAHVLFTTMQKQFTSIPLAEVDVAASAKLNRQTSSGVHAETFLQANRPRPVLVLINSGLEADQRRAIEKPQTVATSKVAAKADVEPRTVAAKAVVAKAVVAKEEEPTGELRARIAAALRQHSTASGGR